MNIQLIYLSIGFRFPTESLSGGPVVSHRGTPSPPTFGLSHGQSGTAESSYSTPSPLKPQTSYGFKPSFPNPTTRVPNVDRNYGYKNSFATSTLKPHLTTNSVFNIPKDEDVIHIGTSNHVIKLNDDLPPISTTMQHFSNNIPSRITDYTSQQHHYTTLSPSVFHSTISHPKNPFYSAKSTTQLPIGNYFDANIEQTKLDNTVRIFPKPNDVYTSDENNIVEIFSES